MADTFAEIQAALATIQRLLDALTARGEHEAAFYLAKTQYASSLRTSWPSNLMNLLPPLEAVANDPTLKLTDDERKDLDQVLCTVRRLCHPSHG